MKKLLPFVLVGLVLGCANLQKSLEKAAKLATGPCGVAVAGAIEACKDVPK